MGDEKVNPDFVQVLLQHRSLSSDIGRSSSPLWRLWLALSCSDACSVLLQVFVKFSVSQLLWRLQMVTSKLGGWNLHSRLEKLTTARQKSLILWESKKQTSTLILIPPDFPVKPSFLRSAYWPKRWDSSNVIIRHEQSSIWSQVMVFRKVWISLSFWGSRAGERRLPRGAAAIPGHPNMATAATYFCKSGHLADEPTTRNLWLDIELHLAAQVWAPFLAFRTRKPCRIQARIMRPEATTSIAQHLVYAIDTTENVSRNLWKHKWTRRICAVYYIKNLAPYSIEFNPMANPSFKAIILNELSISRLLGRFPGLSHELECVIIDCVRLFQSPDANLTSSKMNFYRLRTCCI